ncbi:tRNA lysidine(34) synthetase TilS [Lusitaniella coriacea LEGE 07157]|uniref:tRNA(Ile)-lysidine synthase n=1 Tax=Lusitaniella coriacea LEGE 07157 TaxID=945747 RepID=A0A8J7DY82_9CYAN|nr:tRNA lysidine(34) synthetase TilS [Lusitaniella coriacea]MBE9116624.1 tRNA lysidine(34) synthetase TilS [Lusitaniella coriacea LEGE 07157]
MKHGRDWTHLHTRLHQTCRQRQFLKKQQRLLIAVSGGQDSLCLLKLLLDLQPKWEWQLAIAHCDHNWSMDVGIADHVRHIAQNWDVPFYLKTAHHLKESEASARQWRYQALIEIAQERNFPIIVTGHTLSDRAETLLYNLIRGSGADGLQALTWQRPLTPNLQLIRPLLNISRPETLEFCQQFHLPIWEDAANQNLKYARNRIRTQVLPYLKTHFNPQVEAALARTAEILGSEVEYLEESARTLLAQAQIPNEPSLNRILLRRAALALQRRVVRQFIQQTLSIAPSFEQIEAVTHLINAPNGSRTSTFPGGAVAEVRGDYICLIH